MTIDTWVKVFAIHTDWLELDSRLDSSYTVPKLRLQCGSVTHSSGRAQGSVHTELIWNDQGMMIVEHFFEQQLDVDSRQIAVLQWSELQGIYNLGNVPVINEAVAAEVSRFRSIVEFAEVVSARRDQPNEEKAMLLSQHLAVGYKLYGRSGAEPSLADDCFAVWDCSAIIKNRIAYPNNIKALGCEYLGYWSIWVCQFHRKNRLLSLISSCYHLFMRPVAVSHGRPARRRDEVRGRGADDEGILLSHSSADSTSHSVSNTLPLSSDGQQDLSVSQGQPSGNNADAGATSILEQLVAQFAPIAQGGHQNPPPTAENKASKWLQKVTMMPPHFFAGSTESLGWENCLFQLGRIFDAVDCPDDRRVAIAQYLLDKEVVDVRNISSNATQRMRD
ncbi:hypothetical protein OROHE_017873 [Orobanche hederae]